VERGSYLNVTSVTLTKKGECIVDIRELEVEIAYLEKDLTNAEQNDNEQMVQNLEFALSTLYKKLKSLKEKE
jgi:hypothetical protein